jgi:uncharacterized caspase-like protein
VSWEDDALGHGVFSSAVLEGLSGLADRDGKGLVSAQDLNRFVRERVAKWCRANKKIQTPRLKHDGDGDLVVLTL